MAFTEIFFALLCAFLRRSMAFRIRSSWVYPEPPEVECLSPFAGEPGLA